MTREIVANLVAKGATATKNIIVCGDHVSWSFTNPPKDAKDVLVKIMQQVNDLNENPMGSATRFVGGMLGDFVGGKFIMRRLFGGPPSKVSDPALFHIVHPDGIPAGHILGFTPEPEKISTHVLTLETKHDVDGSPVTFQGQHQLEVRQSLAMVVPAGKAGFDKALNMIGPYAAKWKSFQPDFRHVEQAKIFVTKNIKRIEPSHYDDIIVKITAAAKAAKSGVVALSVGHGSAGEAVDPNNPQPAQGSVTFFNLVPEDNKRAETGIEFLLRIDQTDLASVLPRSDGIKSTPTHETHVRIDALDRLAVALQGTPIRRFMLHTCRAGLAPDFLQLLADRLQVPVVGQKDFIMFQGDPEPASFYYEKGKGTASLPRDERYWPVSMLSDPFYPGTAPPPVGKPP